MSDEMEKKADMTTVAKAAKVSTSTVSRYFNHPELRKPASLKRIDSAVRRTGYIQTERFGQAQSGSLCRHWITRFLPRLCRRFQIRSTSWASRSFWRRMVLPSTAVPRKADVPPFFSSAIPTILHRGSIDLRATDYRLRICFIGAQAAEPDLPRCQRKPVCPRPVNCQVDRRRAAPEWPVSPPRYSINDRALAAIFVLHAFAAKIREVSSGLFDSFRRALYERRLYRIRKGIERSDI